MQLKRLRPDLRFKSHEWKFLGLSLIVGIISPLIAIAVKNSDFFDLEAQKESALETAFRFCSHSGPRDVVFLAINGHDPSDAFLSRFNHDSFSVRKWSRIKGSPTPNLGAANLGKLLNTNSIFDQKTGQRGQIILLHSKTWTEDLHEIISFEDEGYGGEINVWRSLGVWRASYRGTPMLAR